MASNNSNVDVTLNHFDHKATIRVAVSSQFKLRLWAAKKLILIAARILRTGIEITDTGR